MICCRNGKISKFAAPFDCAFIELLPTQFMRLTGIACTKYSRFSGCIVHIGRFFWVISSSRSFNNCTRSGNHVSSHEQTNGLSRNVLFYCIWISRVCKLGESKWVCWSSAGNRRAQRINLKLTNNVDNAQCIQYWFHYFFGDSRKLVVLNV